MVCVYWVEAETSRQLPMYVLCLLGRGRNLAQSPMYGLRLLGRGRHLAAATHVWFAFTGWRQTPRGSYPCMVCVYWVEAETSRQLPMYVLCLLGGSRNLAAVTHVCFVFTGWRQKTGGSYPCMFCDYQVEADTSRQLPMYVLCLLGCGRNLAAVTHVCFVFTG